ncbi:MAG: ATP-binding cassette domain-containing protein [Planctomycetes bacterium]|nr:ATP-binding cassette domain-containing protein [Planctomycetota bacterium]
MDNAIEVRNLSKTYRIYANPWHRLTEKLPWCNPHPYKEVRALQNVNLDIPHGTCVGLVGPNGAGKSTLLKILTGTTYPTGGSYTISGRVASLLELGAGFNQYFSGRENIYMNAALLGLTHAEAKSKYEQILDFSELYDFIDAPIRTYSSGMVCRLGFSVAVATDPEVLIIDEILAVGDMSFRRKCADKIIEFKKSGKTLFFCSHSLYDVRQLCDTAMWIDHGEVKMFGDSVEVTNEYATYCAKHVDKDDASPWDSENGGPVPEPFVGEQMPEIVSSHLIDPKTRERRNVFAPGDDVGVEIHVKNGKVRERLNLAVGALRTDGTLCVATTTEFDNVLIDAEEAIVTLVMPSIKLLSGEFVVPVWLLDEKGVHRFHERPTEDNLIIQNRNKELGLFLVEREWSIRVLDVANKAAD